MSTQRNRFKVWVGRLALSVTEADLTHLFEEECGQVKRVYIAPAAPSGTASDTYGFIEFEQAEAAVKAINILNAKFFHGFSLKVAASHDSSFAINKCSPIPINDKAKPKHMEGQVDKDEAEQRMFYAKKCYAEVIEEHHERNMLALKDFIGYIDREKYVLAEPFSCPVRPIHLDLVQLNKDHAELVSGRQLNAREGIDNER